MSAVDKASGKSEKITITSDKGRLSEEEIQKMVHDAEENAEKDKLLREKVEARNKLESYMYNIKSITAEKDFDSKLSADDKTVLSEAISDGLEWLEASQMDQLSAIEFEEKQKEVENVVSPIMTKVYQASGSPSGQANSGNSDGSDNDSGDNSIPTVEEVE